MKKVFLNLSLILGALTFLAFTNHIDKISVNTAASQVAWKGYKVTGEHAGTINISEGVLEFNHGTFVGGSFGIDMTTIAVTDIQGEYADKLKGHLDSPDFFGVETFPTAKLVIKKVISRGTPGDYKVIADITIRNITKEIKFMANAVQDGSKATATADITIDRSDFDVRYGSGSFIENLGDKTIYDEFDLSVKLVAGK